MSDKITLQTLDSLQNQTSAITKINENFSNVADKIDTLLSRDGDSPNQMESNLDMNSYRVVNLPAPTDPTDAVRKQDLDAAVLEGVPDGDKGDITVSSDGTVWTIDSSVISEGKIQDSAVTTVKIADSAVTTVKIADNAILDSKILDHNVTNSKLSTVYDSTLKGRSAGSGIGNVEDLVPSQVKTILSLPTDTVSSLAGKSPTITDQTSVGSLATDDETLVWDISSSAFRKVTVQEIADLASVPSSGLQVSPYVKFGCLPENISANVERFYKGLITDPGGSPTTAYSLGGSSAYLEVDMTITGAGGRDTGTLASFNNQTAYFYLVIHNTDPLLNKMVASLSLSASSVVRPSGYDTNTPIRLPYSKVYRTTGGFQPHHMKGGQPWTVHLTGWDTGGTWNLVGADNTAGTGSYTDVTGASVWVPNNARLLKIHGRATATSSAGVVYVSSPGISDDKLVGSVNSVGDVDVFEFEIRTSSTLVFQAKATAGVTFSFVVVDYTMSDDC